MTESPNAPADWYPDPDNPGGYRYWDGNAWTEGRTNSAGIGAPQLDSGADPRDESAVVPPPPGSPPPPAAPGGSGTGSGSAATGGGGPTAGGGSKGLPVIVKVLIAACAVMFVGIGGCAVFFGLSIKDAIDEAFDQEITEKQFRSVHVGDTRKEVDRLIGLPVVELTRPAKAPPERGFDCVYYREEGPNRMAGDRFRVCFVKDRVKSKAAF